MVHSNNVLNKGKIIYIMTILIASMLITAPTVGAATGDYLGLIDEYEFEIADAPQVTMIRINNTNYFAMFYMGTGDDGYIKTVEAYDNGTVRELVIDTFEYAPSDGVGVGICHINNSDYYLIGFSETSGGGTARFSTIRIFEDGTIQKHLHSNATMTVAAYNFNITKLSGPFYVSVSEKYGADPDPLYLQTIHVNYSDMSIYVNDTQTVNADASNPRVIALTTNMVAISFKEQATVNKNNVTTWGINPSNGAIDATMTDGQTHSSYQQKSMTDIMEAADGYYIVSSSTQAHGAPDYYCSVGIVQITDAGAILSDSTWASELVFGTGYGDTYIYPRIFTVHSGNMYGLNDGNRIYLFNVTLGTVTLHGLSAGNVLHATRSAWLPNTVYFKKNFFICGMPDTSSDGWFVSFGIAFNYAAPELTPHPLNDSSISVSSTHLQVFASDDNSDDMNINWWSNISGSWVLIGSNNSVGNGTYCQYPAAFQTLTLDTTYYWRVDCIDYLAVHNTSELYHFAYINFTLGIGNTSEYIDLQPNITININETVVDNIDNITWYWWNETGWEWFGNNETGAVSSNYSMHFQNATECCTVYQWAVDLSNSSSGASNFSQYWFITICLSPPTSLNAARYNGTAHNLTWNEWSNVNATGTVRTMIRYSTTSYPTAPTSGTLLYNGTHDEYNHTGLTEGLTYYYSAWTIYHHSTSWCTSSSYSTDSLTAEGGTYNITIRSEATNAKLDTGTAFWNNLRVIARLQDGTVLYNDSLDNHASNPFSIDVNQTPDVVLITYEYWGVIRSLTPAATTRNLTFWFSMRDYWNGSSSTLNTSQIYYTFSFIDLTRNSLFVSSPETKFYVYRDYNSTVTMTIHQMFLGTDREAWASLEYGREYFIGIECDEDHRIRLPGAIFADSDYTKVITIYPKNDTAYFIREYVKFNVTAIENQLWINYTDSSFLTKHSDLKIYKYHSNGTIYLLKNYTYDNIASFNQPWTTVEGYDNDQLYVVEINITHPDFDSIITIKVYSFPYLEGRYDPGWFNSIVEDIFGESPVTGVSHAGLVSFVLGFLFLVTFGQYNGELGLFSCGFAVFFMEVMLWDNSPTRFIAGTVAITMIVLSIIFYLGRSKR